MGFPLPGVSLGGQELCSPAPPRFSVREKLGIAGIMGDVLTVPSFMRIMEFWNGLGWVGPQSSSNSTAGTPSLYARMLQPQCPVWPRTLPATQLLWEQVTVLLGFLILQGLAPCRDSVIAGNALEILNLN